ncbi:MAG: FAD:protein FMN transferase [Proteobacteria bacterium]|nr:FAD:protein FMN transferase [Pseudomonadota bacterium]
MRKSVHQLIVAILIVVVPEMGLTGEMLFSGKTMGTTYRIKIVGDHLGDQEQWQALIDKRLDAVNQSMSTFIADSEIGRFNRFEKIDAPFSISNGFLSVMLAAKRIYQDTDGAWDGTVRPLVNLWGFGTGQMTGRIPSDDDVKTILPATGFYLITISEKGFLMKKSSRVTLDLSSIAKGYGVDDIATALKQNGCTRFLVEIGGEVYASGKKENGDSWKVGINTPRKDAPIDQIYKVVELSDKALATSGDYRNFFENKGKTYSHVIDPRTGYPVKNGVVSVSILSDTCMVADGLATAVMVMGAEKGLDLVNRLENTESLIVVSRSKGSFENIYSKGFTNFEYGKH